MKKDNTISNKSLGKISAVILILVFVGINFYKTDKEGGPQEKLFAEKRQNQIATRKFDNNIAPTQNIEKLKFAYTGKWEKNEIKDTAQVGNYAFAAPTNTRGNIQAVAAKKADKKKAKKTASKKKIKKTKFSKKSGSRSLFDGDYEQPYSNAYGNNGYYSQPKEQVRAPSDDEEKEKKLTAQEWFTQISASNNLTEFLAAYGSGSVSQNLFFSVAEMLLNSEHDNLKKLGFQALGQSPSLNSLMKYAEHINDEMSQETKAYAVNTLKVYNQPNQLRILNSALNNKNNDLKIIAATLIKDITTSILQSEAASGENVVYTDAQITMYRALLTQSLNVINNALQSGLEGSVAASFNSTRTILAEFLS